MLATWIAITLLIALPMSIVAAGMGKDRWGATFAFEATFFLICNISLLIAGIYMAGHFILMHW